MSEERTAPAQVSTTRLSVLYETHVPRGIALARLLTGDDHLAEDLAHDAFLKAAGRFAHIRRPEAFDAYYRRAVVNACKMRFRRSAVERRGLEALHRDHDQVSQAADPSERYEMWDRIVTLPFRQRAVVVLRYYEDLSLDDAAAVLGCSTRAARSLHTRAIASLRRDMAEEEHG
jgi:RNA polymerase sigma factor (sigma-70 family)